MIKLLKIISEIKIVSGNNLNPNELEWLKRMPGIEYFGEGDSGFSDKEPLTDTIISREQLEDTDENYTQEDINIFDIICIRLKNKPFLSNDLFGYYTPPDGLFEARVNYDPDEDSLEVSTAYVDEKDLSVGAFDKNGNFIKTSPYQYNSDGKRLNDDGPDEDEDI